MSYDVYVTTTASAPCCLCGRADRDETIFEWSPTYNLSAMFREAFGGNGLRDFSGLKASECVDRLRTGLADMRARPDHYRQFDAANGWGVYGDTLLDCIEKFLAVCECNPNAIVSM